MGLDRGATCAQPEEAKASAPEYFRKARREIGSDGTGLSGRSSARFFVESLPGSLLMRCDGSRVNGERQVNDVVARRAGGGRSIAIAFEI